MFDFRIDSSIKLHAVSFDYGMKKLLEEFPDNTLGYVHSIFSKALNFSGKTGRLYSIVLSDVCNGPCTIRVDNKQLTNLKDSGISIGERVRFDKDKIEIGIKLTIDLTGARLWIPQALRITGEAFGSFKENLEIYDQCLLLKGADGGAKYFYMNRFMKPSCQVKASPVEAELSKRIGLFLDSIMLKENNLQQRVNSLIGFGNGLTPSGDDFLSGLNVFLYHFKTEDEGCLLKKIENILCSQELSTTDVSRSMLYASLEGMAAESALDFMEALLYKDKATFAKAANKLFAVGSSSGTDISVGIITAARFGFNFLYKTGEVSIYQI